PPAPPAEAVPQAENPTDAPPAPLPPAPAPQTPEPPPPEDDRDIPSTVQMTPEPETAGANATEET
ncbi:MAG: glycoside hydrolase, partial [Anaerolineae bacterium]|nr:glycoside hydrolase [Anaerolineae bacterium]